MDAREMAKIAIAAMEEKKAEDIRVIDIEEVSSIADFSKACLDCAPMVRVHVRPKIVKNFFIVKVVYVRNYGANIVFFINTAKSFPYFVLLFQNYFVPLCA